MADAEPVFWKLMNVKLEKWITLLKTSTKINYILNESNWCPQIITKKMETVKQENGNKSKCIIHW